MSDCDCSNTYYHECRPDDALTAGRHPKWQRVEPGYVIPAGQPYRWEYASGRAMEDTSAADYTVEDNCHGSVCFIDSSWKPPLVLPTEPTWGIAVKTPGGFRLGKWVVSELHPDRIVDHACANLAIKTTELIDLIDLTDEQVQRIEAAR